MTQQARLALEEKEAFIEQLKLGNKIDCPCCGRYAQAYKRQIHKTLANFLLALSTTKKADNGYVFVPAFLQEFQAARDFCILKYWGLIEALENDNETTRTSGYWRVTESGMSFLRGDCFINKWVMVYDDYILGVSDEVISINDVLGESFNYKNLMSMSA